MREHKFRGLDITGNWHYGLIANPKIDIAGGAKKDHWYISNKGGLPFAYEVRQETIGEYICLNDTNGVEIYDGDIVKTYSYRVKNGSQIRPQATRLVTLDIEDSLYGKDKACAYTIYCVISSLNTVEVIGNIYESPDLLKGADNG